MGESAKLSLEEAFKKLDNTIEALESESISLEQSFALYKEGMTLVRKCEKEIDTVEKKVKKLCRDGNVDEFE